MSRLEHALDKLKPDRLTLEATKEDIAKIQSDKEILASNFVRKLSIAGANQEFISWFESFLLNRGNYEYDACEHYAKKNNIDFYMIDNPERKNRYIAAHYLVRESMFYSILPFIMDKKMLVNDTFMQKVDAVESLPNCLAYLSSLADHRYGLAEAIISGVVPDELSDRHFFANGRLNFGDNSSCLVQSLMMLMDEYPNIFGRSGLSPIISSGRSQTAFSGTIVHVGSLQHILPIMSGGTYNTLYECISYVNPGRSTLLQYAKADTI